MQLATQSRQNRLNRTSAIWWLTQLAVTTLVFGQCMTGMTPENQSAVPTSTATFYFPDDSAMRPVMPAHEAGVRADQGRVAFTQSTPEGRPTSPVLEHRHFVYECLCCDDESPCPMESDATDGTSESGQQNTLNDPSESDDRAVEVPDVPVEGMDRVEEIPDEHVQGMERVQEIPDERVEAMPRVGQD